MFSAGAIQTIGDAIQEPSGHIIIFDIIRQTDRGPFGQEDVIRLNALKPDLSRAALMSSRLSFQHAQTITNALSSIGLPSAVIGDGGDVIAMNGEMEAVSPLIRTGARNHIFVEQNAANALLKQALVNIQMPAAPAIQSIPVAAGFETPALVLHLIAVNREARDIFSRSSAVLIATPVENVGPVDLRVISGLFDLTASEARVARYIASGSSIDEAAVQAGVGRETVRTHLKAIFLKTGTTKQSQLVAMLSGLGAVRL